MESAEKMGTDMGNELIYDTVMIGTDLFGLEQAAELAGQGKKVLVLSKNNKPGGAFAAFRRGEYLFRAVSGPDGCGYESALALDRRIRSLGGEIRYKTAVLRITVGPDGLYAVECSDGSGILCREVIRHPQTFFRVKAFATVLLGTDLPAEKITCPEPSDALSVTVTPGKNGAERAVVSLTGETDAHRLYGADEKSYFRIKDEIAEEIISRAEAACGTKLRGHIIEMDVITPYTLARYTDSEAGDQIRELGERLHPPVQFGVVRKVTDRGHAKSFEIIPDQERGTASFAYFRAGQYVSIAQKIGQNIVCKPYSICSGPMDALGSENTSYTVMIERNPEGFFSPHALDTWKPGTKLILSGPLGYAYHMPVRDADHVVALAGSSGITPFFSMASAVADGIENFDLTILYGSRTADTILLREELDALVKRSSGKVRVIHVLSDEKCEGYEYGFITPDLIRKYAPAEDYSIYICGPAAMYDYLHRELPKLCLPAGRIRFELPGEFGDPAEDPEYPAEIAGKEFSVTVMERGTEKRLSCRSEQTLMQAIERSGIMFEADCRSGQCGWCRSRLVSGKVFVPKSRDGRLPGEAENNWIHPCVTYPLTDVVLEIWNH